MALRDMGTLVTINQQTLGTYTFKAGKLRIYGTGGHSFYEDDGSGGYNSPAGDHGTLSFASGAYTYSGPDGRTWHFNGSGYLTKEVSADSYETVSYSYDGSNNLNKVETADGGVATITYSSGLASTIQSTAGTVTLTYSSGDLTKVEDPDGGVRTFTYDANARVTKDQYGETQSTFAYSQGALSSWTDGDSSAGEGITNQITPQIIQSLNTLSPGEQLSEVTDAAGNVFRLQMDQEGRTVKMILPTGDTTQWTRDSNGWVTGVEDGLGRKTTITRDSAGYPTKIEDPTGNDTDFTYQGAFHALTSRTDANGKTYSYTYDGTYGHLLTITDPNGDIVTMTWANGLLQTITDARGNVSTSAYDSLRRFSNATDPESGVQTATYSGGNISTRVDEEGRTTTYQHDGFGRVTQRTDPDGSIWQWAYNSAGLLSLITDPNGIKTSFDHNSFGQISQRVDGVGTASQKTTLFSYNNLGQLTSQRDSNGNWTDFSYDASGRLTSQTS